MAATPPAAGLPAEVQAMINISLGGIVCLPLAHYNVHPRLIALLGRQHILLGTIKLLHNVIETLICSSS